MPSGWSDRIGSIELVWHRANAASDLSAFLDSEVRWVECDARLDRSGVPRVSHEPLDGSNDERWMELREWLGVVASAGRSAKVDIKEGGPLVGEVLRAVSGVGFDHEDLWFNAAVEIPEGEVGFRRIAGSHPGSRLSCPVDTLAPYLRYAAEVAMPIVDLLRSWGVDHLCIGACTEGAAAVVGGLRERGWPMNIWDVENRKDLEVALSLEPFSITADLGDIEPRAERVEDRARG
jgi:hypothetical protein